jgi:hypothetical protein
VIGREGRGKRYCDNESIWQGEGDVKAERERNREREKERES